jgi:hypothetical protein
VGIAIQQAPAPAEGKAQPATPVRRRGWEAVAVVLLLLVAAGARLPTLDQPLVETHAFRQTQTAYTALLIHENGVDLLHPKLPVLGAPFEVPFEFPLFQALAAAPMSWGLSPDVAMRTTALACFLLSALLLWGLVRHAGGRVAALAALAVYLFSPFSLLWSRASLIEYLAVAGALGWVWAGLLWRDRRRAVYAVAALVAGLTAMLVKPTTAALWLLPLVAYTAATEQPGWRSWIRARRDPVLAVIVAVPFLAALAWTGHADAIKAANPATAWLTSEGLTTWNFGTANQRLVWENWARILRRVTGELTGYPAVLFPLVAFVGVRSRQARLWAAFVAVPILTVFCFWNLYVVHDYYLAAVSPAPAALAGVAFARAWRWAPTPRAQRLVLAGLGLSLPTLVLLNAGYVALPYGNPGVEDAHPELAEVLRVTQPGDLIAFEGYDWDPSLPYYARRSGHMLGPERVTTAAELTAEGYRLLVSRRLESDRAVDLVRAGRWTGVLGARTYVTADSLPELRGAPIMATDGLAAAGASLLQQPVAVACGEGGVALPRPDGITVLRLAAGTPAGAKLAVAGGYGNIPVREYVVIDTTLPGPLVVECRDAASVTVEAVTGHSPGTL